MQKTCHTQYVNNLIMSMLMLLLNINHEWMDLLKARLNIIVYFLLLQHSWSRSICYTLWNLHVVRYCYSRTFLKFHKLHDFHSNLYCVWHLVYQLNKYFLPDIMYLCAIYEELYYNLLFEPPFKVGGWGESRF